MIQHLINFVRDFFQTDDFIPLHAPIFGGNERQNVVETIESTVVSSVGDFVNRFESAVASYSGASSAIATVNGTAALHTALILAGVQRGDLVITQPLTFVATCNAISYCGAEPVFVDVDTGTMGLSAAALRQWLEDNAKICEDGLCRLNADKRIIRACVPMHTFGHPADIEGLLAVSDQWGLAMVEDASESLGSFYGGRHTGTFGVLGVLSFNGNKIITTGGGGMILTSSDLGERAKHITTTAKKPHPYEYVHDEVAFNYRLPNLNAALGCAQLAQIENFVTAKRALAEQYKLLFAGSSMEFVCEPENCRSNYWLSAVICEDRGQRDELLLQTNKVGVMTRPIWGLMHHSKMFHQCLKGDLSNAEWLEARVVSLPSSAVSTKND